MLKGKHIGILRGKSVDIDAANYLNAIGILKNGTLYYTSTAQEMTGTEIWSGLNKFVKADKLIGTWDKAEGIYPYIGGTMTAHRYNLKNPVLLSTAFALSYTGSWTHNSVGVTPLGAYADTFWIPNVQTNTTLGHNFSFYNRTLTAGGVQDCVMGTRTGGDNGTIALNIRRSDNASNGTATYGISTTSKFFTGDTNPLGLYECNYFSGVVNLIKNGLIHENGTSVLNRTFPSHSVFIGAINNKGSGAADFSNKNSGFTSVGKGFTFAESVARKEIIDELMFNLKRNV